MLPSECMSEHPNREAHVEAILQRIRGSALFRQAEEEAEAEELQRREEMVEELAELRAERSRTMTQLNARLEDARERLLEVAAEHKRARDAKADAESEALQANLAFDTRIGRLETELRATCSPLFERFGEACRDEAVRLRKMTPERAYYRRRTLAGSEDLAASNRDSILERLEVVGEIVREAERLKLEPLGPEEVEAALDALWGRLPEIEPAEAFLPEGAKPVTHRPSGNGERPHRQGWAFDWRERGRV